MALELRLCAHYFPLSKAQVIYAGHRHFTKTRLKRARLSKSKTSDDISVLHFT